MLQLRHIGFSVVIKSVKFTSNVKSLRCTDVCIMQNNINMDDALIQDLIFRQSSTESRTRPARGLGTVLLLVTHTDTSSSFSEQRV